MNLKLILCAFGLHRWCLYMARSRTAERNTQRECGRCQVMQERETQKAPWRNV